MLLPCRAFLLRLPRTPLAAAQPVPSRLGPVRRKRYSAFDAHLDHDALAEARRWHESFDASQLPRGTTTYSRSSGPGGQHVNKTETKATSVYAVQDILAAIPPILHDGVRLLSCYTAGNDSLTFQAQTHRSRTANTEENGRKLVAEIMQLYRQKVPAETGADKHAKYKAV